MKRFPLLLSLWFACLATNSIAQEAGLIRALAECSPGYFAQLSKSQDFISAGYAFDVRGRLLVPNHRDELGTGYRVLGKQALSVGGLEVVGLYDLHRKANTFEALDWGVLVRGSPRDLVRTINALMPEERRLEADQIVGLGFARLDISSVRDWPKWRTPRPLPKQAPPEFGAIEMLMEVGPEADELPGVSRVGCSMQGVFPPFVIRARRPDIE